MLLFTVLFRCPLYIFRKYIVNYELLSLLNYSVIKKSQAFKIYIKDYITKRHLLQKLSLHKGYQGSHFDYLGHSSVKVLY